MKLFRLAFRACILASASSSGLVCPASIRAAQSIGADYSCGALYEIKNCVTILFKIELIWGGTPEHKLGIFYHFLDILLESGLAESICRPVCNFSEQHIQQYVFFLTTLNQVVVILLPIGRNIYLTIYFPPFFFFFFTNHFS